MKAAVMEAAGGGPVYGEFREPAAGDGLELIAVTASALSNFSKSRSAGRHYSSEAVFPVVAGAEGVGRTADGRRVFFALPETPFGALAERCVVRSKLCVPVPEGLSDVEAAALANPGMSAWAALVERARLVKGETVLVNGATGSAGKVAVQLAKYLGAAKVIATGRNAAALKELKLVGSDAVVAFDLAQEHGAKLYERALMAEFADGVDVVLDYLWGETAKTAIVAIARSVEDAQPVRFVHVGGASGEESIELPGAALRSSAIQLMGSGIKSVSMQGMLAAVAGTFAAAVETGMRVETVTRPLEEIAEAWELPGRPRVVVTIG